NWKKRAVETCGLQLKRSVSIALNPREELQGKYIHLPNKLGLVSLFYFCCLLLLIFLQSCIPLSYDPLDEGKFLCSLNCSHDDGPIYIAIEWGGEDGRVCSGGQ